MHSCLQHRCNNTSLLQHSLFVLSHGAEQSTVVKMLPPLQSLYVMSMTQRRQ